MVEKNHDGEKMKENRLNQLNVFDGLYRPSVLDGLYRSNLDLSNLNDLLDLSRSLFPLNDNIRRPQGDPTDALWKEPIRPWAMSLSLATDYFIENNTITLNVDVAGSSSEDVEVTVDTERYVVDVKVKKQYEKKESKPSFKIRERILSEQARQFHLPRNNSRQIDFSSFTATVKNGLLTIKVNYTEPEEKPKEKLTIKVN